MDSSNIPECFYRVSAKALVLNETRDKFLIIQEHNGIWELPGGGLDWDTTPQEDLPREISEEMGLRVTWIADQPSYFLTNKSLINKDMWTAQVLYETKLEHLNFIASDECVDIKFIDASNVKELKAYPCVTLLAEIFKPENHS